MPPFLGASLLSAGRWLIHTFDLMPRCHFPLYKNHNNKHACYSLLSANVLKEISKLEVGNEYPAAAAVGVSENWINQNFGREGIR